MINKTLKYAGITLTVAAVALDTYRICSAIQEDLYIGEHADEIILELKESISTLKARYREETNAKRRREIRLTYEHLEKVLADVKLTQKMYVKTIRTASSVGGSWVGGLGAGAAGAWAGTQTGAAIGAFFGPVGAVVGAPVGAVVGAISAGIGGSYVGSNTAEYVADQVIDQFRD